MVWHGSKEVCGFYLVKQKGVFVRIHKTERVHIVFI